jgi:hypothetical protein
MAESSEAHDEYPELFQLVAGFFNEDWFDDYADEAAAVADYVSQTTEEVRREALGEMRRLRTVSTSEPALAETMSKLGSGYSPRYPPTPMGDFLDRLIRALEDSIPS